MVSKFQKAKVASAVMVLVAALAGSASAQAQGLGELVLESNLNEPLRAHIALLDVGNFDASQIQVALASADDFASRNLERNPILDSVGFGVTAAAGGGLQVDVSSTRNIEEPYLIMLVDVRWPGGGRALREYTVLLELPGRQPLDRTSQAAGAQRAAVAVAPAESAAPASPAPTAAPAQQYTVQAGDTAFNIAERMRPGNQVSVQQMMLAIQRANEDAFVNNNVNRILTGKVLRIPTIEEISIIDQDAAVAQIAQQTQALGNQPLATSGAAAPSGAPRDELTILSGNQQGAAGAGSSDLDATIKQLESELMLSEETVDRARLENLELTNRLSALQEEIELLQNIIAIEDERIAQLQAQLRQQAAKTTEALAAAEQPAASEAEEGGLLGVLKGSVMVLGGALAVAVALVVGLLVRRRNLAATQGELAEQPLADIDDDVPEAGGGLMAKLNALLAGLFKRREKLEPQEPVFEPELESPPAAEAPAAEPAVAEVEVSEEFDDLSSALDAVEEEVAVEEPATESAAVEAQQEAAAALSEVDLLEQALNEAELDEPDDAELPGEEQPAPAAMVTPPESYAFTPSEPEVESQVEVVEEVAAAPAQDTPDVFEFSLPDFDEPEAASEPAIEVESIPFTTNFAPEPASSEPAEPELNLAQPAAPADTGKIELDDLETFNFDDTTLGGEEDEEATFDVAAGGSQDTHDARLDLAVAYEAMGDIDGAIEILDEVIANGRASQVAEAERLKVKWQNA